MLIRKIRSRGFFYSVGIVINRLVPESIFRFRVFQIFELALDGAGNSTQTQRGVDSETKLATTNASDAIQFRWCETEADLQLASRLTHFHAVDEGGKRIADLDKKMRACLAWEGDKPVGGVWISHGSFLERDLGLVIELDPDDRWLFAAYIEKSHRRRGIYARLLTFVMTTDSRTKVFASINLFNKASIAAHRHMTARVHGICWAGHLLGLSGCRSSGDLLTLKPIGSRIRIKLQGSGRAG